MSNTTVSTYETKERARLAEIRAQQEAERRARIKRERAAQAEARNQILAAQARFRRIESRQDAASQRLPDLIPISLEWPDAPAANAGARSLQVYVALIDKQIAQFERDVNAAIKKAEVELQRREATAAAWRSAHDASTQARTNRAEIERLGQQSGLNQRAHPFPKRPSQDAQLETVQAYLAQLHAHIAEQEAALKTLQLRANTQARAAQLSGPSLAANVPSTQALAAHAAEKRAQARQGFNASLAQALAAQQLEPDDLSPSLQRLIEGARNMAEVRNWHTTLSDWIAREASRRRDTAHALILLSTPPEGVLETPALCARWQQLASRLQAIMGGHEVMSANVQSEHMQLEQDAQRQLNYRLSRATCLAQLAAQGMHVLTCEDGGAIIEIDKHTWLEIQEFQSQDGQYAASYELYTDAVPGQIDDAAVIHQVCQTLPNAGAADVKVTGQSQVVERKRTIERRQKPRRAQAMTMPL